MDAQRPVPRWRLLPELRAVRQRRPRGTGARHLPGWTEVRSASRRRAAPPRHRALPAERRAHGLGQLRERPAAVQRRRRHPRQSLHRRRAPPPRRSVPRPHHRSGKRLPARHLPPWRHRPSRRAAVRAPWLGPRRQPVAALAHPEARRPHPRRSTAEPRQARSAAATIWPTTRSRWSSSVPICAPSHPRPSARTSASSSRNFSRRRPREETSPCSPPWSSPAVT